MSAGLHACTPRLKGVSTCECGGVYGRRNFGGPSVLSLPGEGVVPDKRNTGGGKERKDGPLPPPRKEVTVLPDGLTWRAVW